MSYIRRNQPQFKLTPQQPFTNSKLAIYVAMPDNSPINFYVLWRRINLVAGLRQQIKNNEGNLYDASPLDYRCIIQVIVNYELYGCKYSKVLSFPPLKLNYELQERQLYVIESIPCKLQMQEILMDVKVIAKKHELCIISPFRQFQMSISDAILELKNNMVTISFRFEHRFNQFVMFLADSIGWTPRFKYKIFELTFLNRLDRDFIILMLIDSQRQSTSSIKSNNSKTPRKDILNVSSNRNNKEKSLSASKNKDGKIKISSKVLKNSSHLYKDKSQFENLNESEFKTSKQVLEKSSEMISMDLRDSFAELETHNSNKFIQQESNCSHLHSKLDSKIEIKGQIRLETKLIQQNSILKQENNKLKQQLESMNILAKENILLKKKYMNLTQQINRMQLERKQILEDKLRFQSNFYRQMQQKQYLKKQLDALRQMVKVQNQRDHSLSPYNKHHDRPITPDRPKQKTRDLKSSAIVYQDRPRY